MSKRKKHLKPLNAIDRDTPPNWIIHAVMNGQPCTTCGKITHPYLPPFCDAHTHGMAKYGHLEFQVVLDIGVREVCYVLNELGWRVRAGYRFHDGQYVDGVFLDCQVRLDLVPDSAGIPVLRVIIPDNENRWPEDEDVDSAVQCQLLPLDCLRNPEERDGCC